MAPVCSVKHEPGRPLRARVEDRVWESEEEKRVRNCLGVDGKPTRETQDYGLWQSDSLRSENMNLK